MRVVIVCRRGKEYDARHARWLIAQIRRHNPHADLHCLTDERLLDHSVNVHRFKHDLGGWWSKMEIYNPEMIPGDLLYIDLDSVVVGDLEPLIGHSRSLCLSDFYKPQYIGSGVLWLKEADRAPIYEHFMSAPADFMARCRTRSMWGDQGFLEFHKQRFDRWDKVRPGQLVSYKVHVARQGGKIPAGARIVCFHGQPRPWHVSLDWIPRL